MVNAGARSRWANVLTGVFVAVGILLFAGLIERLPMTSLAAILIYAGYKTLKPARVRAVWNTNRISRTIMIVTFIFTLYLPVQKAVFLGVALQVVMFVIKLAERMTIMELMPVDNGDFREQPAPDVLPDHKVTILLPYGSLFFAGAADFAEEIPAAEDAQGAIVILVLRGRLEVGSTFLNVVQRYATTLRGNGGRFILADVDNRVREQLARTGALDIIGEENVLPANPLMAGSMLEAYAIASESLKKPEG